MGHPPSTGQARLCSTCCSKSTTVIGDWQSLRGPINRFGQLNVRFDLPPSGTAAVRAGAAAGPPPVLLVAAGRSCDRLCRLPQLAHS
ncbi:hypothetical protein C8K44_12640 [Aminobacter sp. AP02]|nr:hypothetical protein C8K44_12640 [Aminobacter sp. AP02]